MSVKKHKTVPQMMEHVRAAIREIESALGTPALQESGDVVACQAEGRLMGALESTKEALASLQDVFE